MAIQIIDLDDATLDPLVVRALRRLHLRLEQVRAAQALRQRDPAEQATPPRQSRR